MGPVRALLGSAVDLRGSTEIAHGLKVRTWFATAGRCSPGTAGQVLQLGRTLRLFPLLGEACSAGEVGIDHVDVVRRACNPRITDALIELDERLCELARSFGVREFTRAVARIVAMIDLDGPVPECRDTDTLRVAADLSGGVHLDGSISGENAVHLAHALNTEMGRQRRLARADADAGIAMPAGSCRAAPRVVATLDGDPVDPVTAAVLLCDAHLSPLVCDSTGRPLHYGRHRRRTPRTTTCSPTSARAWSSTSGVGADPSAWSRTRRTHPTHDPPPLPEAPGVVARGSSAS